jgi:hypothetical protein
MVDGLPGVSSVITCYINNKMANLDIAPFPEFVELIAETGGDLYSCNAAMDLFGFQKHEFTDQVRDINAAREFCTLAVGGRLIFTCSAPVWPHSPAAHVTRDGRGVAPTRPSRMPQPPPALGLLNLSPNGDDLSLDVKSANNVVSHTHYGHRRTSVGEEPRKKSREQRDRTPGCPRGRL